MAGMVKVSDSHKVRMLTSQTCPRCGDGIFSESDVQEDILANQYPVVRNYCPTCGWSKNVAV